MPELPEVETIRRGLEQSVLEKKILNVEIRKYRIVKQDNQFFIDSLEDQKFVEVRRHAKFLVFVLSHLVGCHGGELVLDSLGCKCR